VLAKSTSDSGKQTVLDWDNGPGWPGPGWPDKPDWHPPPSNDPPKTNDEFPGSVFKGILILIICIVIFTIVVKLLGLDPTGGYISIPSRDHGHHHRHERPGISFGISGSITIGHNHHNHREHDRNEGLAMAQRFCNANPPILIASPDASVDPNLEFTMIAPRFYSGYDNGYARFDIGPMNRQRKIQRLTIHTARNACIQSNAPLATWLPPAYTFMNETHHEGYFSAKIVSMKGQDGNFAIGFSTFPYPPFRLPGWDPHSIGYHSKDGNVFHNNPNDGVWVGKAKAGDTIGIGYTTKSTRDCTTLVFYFVHNNRRITKDFCQEISPFVIYPTIGCDCDVEVELHFKGKP
jgi:hypothetical protein